MKYRQHYKTERLSARAESALGFLLAFFIALGLSYWLIVWWSS